jgi:hypothetical protein
MKKMICRLGNPAALSFKQDLASGFASHPFEWFALF